MDCNACKPIYDVKDTDQVSELHQKLDTGKYLLFGQPKEAHYNILTMGTQLV